MPTDKEQAILLANCRMTDYLLAELKRCPTASAMLEWADNCSSLVLHYSDFVRDLPASVASELYGARCLASYFVPYLLVKVVDPVLRKETLDAYYG